MPIDSNIALGIKPAQIESPINQMAQMYQLQNAQQSNQLNQMKMQDLQRASAKEEKLNALVGGFTPEMTDADKYNSLLRGGHFAEAKSFNESANKANKDKRDAETSALTNVEKTSALHRDNLWGVTDTPSATAWVENLYKDPIIGANLSSMVPKDKMLASIPTDPAQLADWKNQVAMGSKEFAKQSIPKPSDLARLQTELAKLPLNDPNRAAYVDAINKATIEPAMQEYNLAKTQGYKGSFLDFKLAGTTATNERMASEGNKNRQNALDVAKLRNSGDLTPEQNDALYGANGAVTTGKLDPYKVNSRNSHILANAYLSNPNTDMNKLASDAVMMRNAPTMNRAYTTEQLPTIISNVVDAGKKVNYSDAKFFGKVQEFINGQSNDPNFINYMTQRNDALLTITSIMRGNGATDQAHRAEIEAAPSTMSPKAFDAWAAGQMKALEPRLKQANKFTRTQPAPAAATSTPTTGANPHANKTDAEIKAELGL